jgi:hypothetical protein
MAGIITSVEFSTVSASIWIPSIWAETTEELATPITGIFVANVKDDEDSTMATQAVFYSLQNMTDGSAATDFAYSEYYADWEELGVSGYGIEIVDPSIVQGSDCTINVFSWANMLEGFYGPTSLIFQLTCTSVASPDVSSSTTFILHPEPAERGVTPTMTWAYVWSDNDSVVLRRMGGYTGTKTVTLYGYVTDDWFYEVPDDELWDSTDAGVALTSPVDDGSTCTVTVTGYTTRTVTVSISSITAPLVEAHDVEIPVSIINFMPWMKRKRPLKIRRK